MPGFPFGLSTSCSTTWIHGLSYCGLVVRVVHGFFMGQHLPCRLPSAQTKKDACHPLWTAGVELAFEPVEALEPLPERRAEPVGPAPLLQLVRDRRPRRGPGRAEGARIRACRRASTRGDREEEEEAGSLHRVAAP